MSLFQTLAAALVDGTPPSPAPPTVIAETGFPSIVRSGVGPVGVYDCTFANPNPSPTQKVVVKITCQPLPAGGHNVLGTYAWVTAQPFSAAAPGLRISLRTETTGALSDAVFSVEVSRVTAQGP